MNRMDDLIRRQDAIRVASGYCHWTNIPKELAKLPSVNPIPCEDAISRQAAIDALNNSQYSDSFCKEHNIDRSVNLGMVRIVLNDLPSISVEEKVGRWEWVQYDSNPNIGNWHCSECNRIVCGAITAANPVYAYKYCPNCGARMRDVVDESVDESVDECRFLCRWNKDFKCTKDHNERWCKGKIFGEVGESE